MMVRIGCLLCSVSVAGLLFVSPPASAAAKAKPAKPRDSAPAKIAVRYAEAVSQGNLAETAKLDFACQYRLVSASGGRLKSYPDQSDPSYAACWEGLKKVHEPALKRTDIGMDVLWPSNGGLVFFGEEVDRYPASAFVMDAIGLSPPGSGIHLKVVSTKPLPNASFPLRRNQPLVSVPTSLVTLEVSYQDPLTSPVTKAPGSYKWTNTVKPARRALKSIQTQWVVMTGLKRHGFPGDSAVLNLLVKDSTPVEGIPQEIVPFVTQFSKVVPGSLVWWGPNDMPGLLVASAARAAGFPTLRDRVALLNRVLIIDPKQADALTVLTRDLYAVILKEATPAHGLVVKDPALALAVNEHYWNTYAQTTRMDLSLGMEMGGLDKPTTADYLYRLLPALRTLAEVRPEQLDNRFRWGAALRWNNDQDQAIHVDEDLVKDIPDERKSGKAEALLQLAWSRINKVAWNRILDDPEVRAAYKDADQALAFAEVPLDKFLAEYTKAYSVLYTPNRNNREILERLTEAQRWFEEVPGHTPEVWNFFIGSEQMKMVLDADPIFQPLLASGPAEKG
ncbi:MAG TPA: hypothetical protein VFS39_11120 [Nitrospira sp.]|nr:hypothetical protein [Nitrospira sp.]